MVFKAGSTVILEEVRVKPFRLYLQTISTLENIKYMMMQIQDSIAGDVHSVSPVAMAMMEQLDRPPERPKVEPGASPRPRADRRRSVLSKISETSEQSRDPIKQEDTILDLDYMGLSRMEEIFQYPKWNQ